MGKVGIVGTGPAGMMAALEAAKRGARVLLFDSNPMVGRKLLVTGNGRCNLSNANAAADRYTCADPAFLEQALAKFGHEHLSVTLRELGILTYATHDGWCYPLSNSAATVVDTFAAALELAGVEIHLWHKIVHIRRSKGKFVLEADVPDGARTYTVERVIVAAGGKAHPVLGSKGECFPLLKELGHTVVPIHPALVPIRADVKRFHKLQGVRLDVGLALFQGDNKLHETVGNMLFTRFGFSGPASMNLSHLVSTHEGPPLRLTLNLIPHHLEELRQLIARKRADPISMRVILGAVLPVKIPPVFLWLAGLGPDVCLNQISNRSLEKLLGLLISISVKVKGTREFKFSQLSTGGVPVTEVVPHSMASRRVKGLYLAGEVLDVVGPCGGYNLQYAFTSGAIAGMAAGGE
ncbi:MAG: aminoacetone oxidase family FAD-binding enzyme [Chloroflexi bacterium]|nr:aminoacetone oxidase family FAD-binding enzyme [Chloroflexota bacterium]